MYKEEQENKTHRNLHAKKKKHTGHTPELFRTHTVEMKGKKKDKINC